MLKKISSQTVILSLGILIIVFAFFFYVRAWQEPTVAPPGGNVPPPINTGTANQTKSGGLTVSGVLSSPMFYDSGNLNYFVNPSGYSNIGGKVSISPTIPDAPKYIALSIGNGNLQMVAATEPSTWASSGDINAKRLCINGVCQGSWPTGGITGSGTTTQIAFFTGSTSIGSDPGFYWDNINKRLSVGTGTTSPSFKIDVYGGDINTSGVYRQNGTAGISLTTPCTSSQVLKGANVRGGIVTGGSCAADETGVGGGAPTDASYVVLGLNGTLTAERVLTAGTGISIADGGVNGNLTITNTGDLSNTNEIQNIIANKGLQRDTSNNFGISNCTTNNQIMKYNTTTGQWACANDEAGGISWPLLAPDGTAGAPSYSFSADTNTGLFRSAADTLAITTGGISRLAISTTAVNSSLPLTVTTLTTSDGNLFLNDLTEEGDISRADQIYGLNDLRLGGDSDFTGEPDQYSDLYINPGGDVSVLNGNLGVGTASPSSKLKIQLKSFASWDTEDGLVIQDGSYNNGDVLKVLNAGGTTTWLVVDKNGNVGIGINTPAHLLHVAKSDGTNPVTLKVQNVQGTVSADVQLILGTGQALTTDTMGAILYADRVTDGGSTDLIFKTSAGITMYNRMIIKADGRIGVGTTTPTYLFDVAGGDINTSGFYRQGGTPGLSSTTCDPNQVLKGANIRGGIVTGGSCVADETGVTAEENLKIIRGRVNSDGTVASGSGFTVAKTTSDLGGGFTQTTYTITFTTPFTGTGLPTVVASIDNPGSSGATIYVNVISNNQVAINPRHRYPCGSCPPGHTDPVGSGYSGLDIRFSFIAVGLR